jgi:hypothetical protein
LSKFISTAYYIDLTITLAKGVALTPQVGSLADEIKEAAGTEKPTTTYYGAKWQINC